MKKVFMMFMAALLTLSSLTFYSGNTPVKADGEFVPKEDVVLCDFEEWKPDFSTLRIGGDFGKVTRSEEYVASGKYSAKLQPGGPYAASTPYVTIPLTSRLYGFKYIMSDYVALTGKFYNAETDNVSMEIGLSFSGYGNKIPTKYTLTPGWNDVTYVINHDLIQMFNGSMEGVSNVFFRFEPSLSRDINDSDVIYADDIVLRAAKTAIEPVDLVKLSPMEICDFERPYQEYVMSSWVYQATPPDYKIVDIREGQLPRGIIPTSGNCCLEITMKARTDNYQAYPQAIITEHVVARALNSLTEEEKQRAYIAFDIYAYTTAFVFDLGFKDSVTGGMHSMEPNDSIYYTAPSYKGSWTTYRYKLTDIDNPESVGRGGQGDFYNNPKEIRFVWADFFNEPDRVIYLDNVRIELEAKQ